MTFRYQQSLILYLIVMSSQTAAQWFSNPELENMDDREEVLTLVETLFTQEWLNSKDIPRNPLQWVWQNPGFVQAIELYTFGKAIKEIKPLISGKTWITAEKYIKGNDPGLRAGVIFELLSALIASNRRQNVTMPPASQPGYDLLISVGEKCARVSCKALLPSIHEKKFAYFSTLLRGITKLTKKPPGGTFISFVLLDNTNEFKYDIRILPRFAEVIQKWQHEKDIKPMGYGINGWFASFNHLKSTSYPFMKSYSSFLLLVAAEFTKDEQIRFNSKIAEAVTNLGKHCSDVDENKTNLIFMRIPNAISISAAQDFTSQFWEINHSTHIAGLFLLRPKITTTHDMKTTVFSWEHEFIDNPYAKISYKSIFGDEGMELTLPIGTPVRNNSRLILLNDGKESLDLTFKYSLIAGEHHYDAGLSSEIDMLRLPFIDTAYHNIIDGESFSINPTSIQEEINLI